MASGIKDKVVILGMGCSKFGERWESSPSDLMVEAFEECIQDAGIERNQIEAAWFGAGIDSGSRVSMHFRIKQFDSQRGFRKYFWKAVIEE